MLNKINKLAISVMLLMLMVLSSCNTSANSANPENSEPTLSEVSRVEGVESHVDGTRIINTSMGDVEVPMNPQRIVVDYLIGDVVALGVIPVGVSKNEETGGITAFASYIEQSQSVGEWDLDLESVMALEPDLIILSFSPDPYDDLSKIAPTIYVPYGEMSTKERINFIGNALNRQEQADKVLNEYGAKVSQAKQKLKDAGLYSETVSVGQFTDDGNYVAGAKHAVGVILYNELEILPPEKVQQEIIDKDEYWGTISMEVLEGYCGDYIISLDKVSPSIEKNEVWKLIPAVGNENVMSVDTSISWYTDIMSASALVDKIIDGLIELKQ